MTPVTTPKTETKVLPGCSCNGWRENIEKVNAPFLREAARGNVDGYTGKPFAFCPWCASALPAPEPSDVR